MAAASSSGLTSAEVRRLLNEAPCSATASRSEAVISRVSASSVVALSMKIDVSKSCMARR